jgi:hypothetical protein
MRIEPATNDVTDYGVKKAVENLPQLREKLSAICDNGVTPPFVKNCTLRPGITRRTGVNPTSQDCSWAGPRSDQDCPAGPAIRSSGTIFLQARDLTYNFLQTEE